jgi:hypothetical protein
MHPSEVYLDLDGREICLGHLDAEERKLLARIRRRAHAQPDGNEFDNYWTRAVGEFYDARGVPRALSRRSVLFQVAADLSGRLAVAAGFARIGDYRDELEELIEKNYPNRRAFCKATGLSEDMLSHVLTGRKDLSLESLTRALERIGYRLRLVPAAPGGPARQTLPKTSKRRARSA